MAATIAACEPMTRYLVTLLAADRMRLLPLGSCPYSCVEAGFLGRRERRESLRVAGPKETFREATNTIPST
jgi:hypothetical protein